MVQIVGTPSPIEFTVSEVLLSDIVFNPSLGSFLRNESADDLSGHPKATSQKLTLTDGKGQKVNKMMYVLQLGEDSSKVLKVSQTGLAGLGFQPGNPEEVSDMWSSATGGKQCFANATRLFHGLHIADLFGRVCACLRDKSQHDSFVRLTTEVELLQRLRKLVLASVHKMMRKPLNLLLKVLVETGVLEIVTGNEDPIKIKTNDVVTEEAVVSE